MRKVTLDILRAFNNRQKKTIKNTSCDGDNVYLHGNKIVTRNPVSGKVFIRTAGWNTVTTRERLNAFTMKRIYQKNFDLYCNDIAWNGDWMEA